MKTSKGWTVAIVGIVVSLMMGISAVLAAADYPTRAIDVVIPYGPGGGTDLTVRLFKDHVEKLLGQPIVINYKPGAGGVIAGTYVKNSKPDGYTFLVISISSMSLSILTRKADFTIDDFVPVSTLTRTSVIFAVNKDSPYKTFKDLVQAAKTKNIKYTSTGVNSPGQLFMEAIGRQEGFQAIHVPGGGGAKAMTAVLGGHVDLVAVAPTGIESQLRVLAVASDNRLEAFPDVPTLKELGYPIAPDNYFSLYAPKGTPKAIVDKVYGAYKKAFEENREEITKITKTTHQVPRVLSPAELGKITRDSFDVFKDMVSKMKGSGKEN